MNKDFDSKEFRDAFVEEFLRTGVAFQIRALRDGEKWSQKQLGDKTGKPQNVISRLEDPDYGNYTIRTLLELASAFDVGLLVRFVSFGDLWRTAQQLSPDVLAVPKYEVERSCAARPRIGQLRALPAYLVQGDASGRKVSNQVGANLLPTYCGLVTGQPTPVGNTPTVLPSNSIRVQ